MILHVDLDAFFASVEERDDPRLRGRALLVGGNGRRGVVAAASYEARRFGCRSAMPMAEAVQRCPHAVVLPPRIDAYRRASRAFFAILDRSAPAVEKVSIDEAFLDVGGMEKLTGGPQKIAATLKETIRAELDLIASVGIAPTKFAAKIASDIDKPDGLRVVAEDELCAFLEPLPVTRLWGVGEKTRARLAELGLFTIGDVARHPERQLCARLGDATGHHLAALARGDDPRPVETEREPRSFGSEETFERDIGDRQKVEAIVTSSAHELGGRLRRAGVRAKVVALKLRYGDFRTLQRQRTLAAPSHDGMLLARVARELLRDLPLDDSRGPRYRARLAGVSASGLVAVDAPRQLCLNEAEDSRGERVGAALDAIQDRFGRRAIGIALGRGARELGDRKGGSGSSGGDSSGGD